MTIDIIYGRYGRRWQSIDFMMNINVYFIQSIRILFMSNVSLSFVAEIRMIGKCPVHYLLNFGLPEEDTFH